MQASVLRAFRRSMAGAIAFCLTAALFLSVGVFGLTRGEWVFLAGIADGLLLLLLAWFAGPVYQFGKLPARGVAPLASLPAPKNLFQYWTHYRALDHELGLPKKKAAVYAPLLLTVLAAVLLVAAVFLIGNALFPAGPAMGMDPGMGMDMDMGMAGMEAAAIG